MKQRLRSRAAPDNEKTTKSFYRRYQEEHARFLAGVRGIGKTTEKEHYTTLLLNRIIFLYFLQKRGLLNGDRDYLKTQLQYMQSQKGVDTFYPGFLLPLFYKDSDDTVQIQGEILILLNKLFKPYQPEKKWPRLRIADAAFARLFSFLDSYSWCMDQPSATRDQEITPDIMGNVFEQHTNHQHMGAYYTKADITSYIAQNTIIPYLLEMVEHEYPRAFSSDGPLWQLLSIHPERYIQHELRQREPLPGESEQEQRERRERYLHLKRLLVAGEIHTCDQLITYNLNSALLARDCLQQSTDPQLLISFYGQLRRISVLDPTCGAGAFLFAALHTLAPLHEACIERMDSLQRQGYAFDSFPQVPSTERCAFILQDIISNNLYGIDIMEEASEICKLRLLLKLLAYSEDGSGRADLRFNIHSGNLLAEAYEQGQRSMQQAEIHWEHEVLKNGGFSVIIGNPPYVEYNKNQFPYTLQNYATLACNNLYPCIIEHSRALLAPRGRHGMILPLAAFSTRNMIPFIESFQSWFPGSWLSFYHFRPSMLFTGGKSASIPTCIYLARASGEERRFSTRLIKWTAEQRRQLFSLIYYSQVSTPNDSLNRHYYPKFGHERENAILEKILQHTPIRDYLAERPNDNAMYYRSAGGLYWKIFINFAWPYQTTSNKQCSFKEDYERDIFVALFNSSLFWWYYTVTFDTFNLKDYMLFGFRFSYPEDPETRQQLQDYSQQLMASYRTNAEHLTRGKTGSYTIYARKSKEIIDEIDRVLGRHYGFTEQEIAFIINYDLKYRTGFSE